MTLDLTDVSGGFDCELYNYGKMRDTIGHFSYKFSSGIYVLKGECGMGGWALSTLLCGKDKITEGKIYIENNVLTQKDLQKKSCYVGSDTELRKLAGLLPMTVKEQITAGVKNNMGYINDVQKIKDLFQLSDSRFDRTMPYMSGERWKASMAIGYALGKCIYCFPWLNSAYIKNLDICLSTCLPQLAKVGAIIIIPTTYPEVLNGIVKDYAVVDLDRLYWDGYLHT
jgi:ABC-type transport system involved in cytochrome c biogenesis ATPase subunit